MISLKNYSLNIPEEDYHALPAWSYSLIAKYARNGFPAIATLLQKTEPTPEMKFGSLFDRIVTGNGNAKDEYIVLNIAVPEAEKKMLETLASITNNKAYPQITDEEFLAAQQVAAYQMRFKLDTVKSRLDPYVCYYDALASGKTIVSSADWNDAQEMADAIWNSPYLSTIFGKNNSDTIEYIYQAQFKKRICIDEYALQYVDIKIMPDLMVVNHSHKTIQPVDLKSSSMPAYQFAEHFVKMRYDLQASVYTDVLQELINDIPEYSDYTILSYLFTDISRTDKVPVTFEYDPRSESQINGFTIGGEKQYTYKTWKQLLCEIVSYINDGDKVPAYIALDCPNDLLSLLSR